MDSGLPKEPQGKGKFWEWHLPAHCEVSGISSVSNVYSVGGSSYAAFSCQYCSNFAFIAVTLLVWQQKWWGAGVVIRLERGADLHMAQLIPLPLTVSCFSKIQIAFTFLVPEHPGSPGQRAVKWALPCVCQYCSNFLLSNCQVLQIVPK